MPWYTEDWSRGILLGLDPDPTTGYRATIWFEYTRALFNEIREGSLVAVRNFNDRPSLQSNQSSERSPTYEEYSILQIDQVHPWHYAIQGSGDRGYPAFNVAAAESARRDWVEWDVINRDDVTRIRCEAIPLRLAFSRPQSTEELPLTFADRSKPMPGHEVRVLKPHMTERIVNQGLDLEKCIEIGHHVVQSDVSVHLSLADLVNLHFGVFGFTGAGKSNLISTLSRLALSKDIDSAKPQPMKIVVFDLMDEYTGLLIDQLVKHRYSRVVIAGRNAVDANLFTACEAVAVSPRSPATRIEVQKAAKTWSERIVLPRDLRDLRSNFVSPLSRLIEDGKVVFYESLEQQGAVFDLAVPTLIKLIPVTAFGEKNVTAEKVKMLDEQMRPLVKAAGEVKGSARDEKLEEIVRILSELYSPNKNAQDAFDKAIRIVNSYKGSRGQIAKRASTFSKQLVGFLNGNRQYDSPEEEPSLLVIVGENETSITGIGRQLIQDTFDDRRTRSLLDPPVSFVMDEADVFVSQKGQPSKEESAASLVEQATLLARRGRKFGLGLGIATQRIRYLNTSIMAQPHTYFISKLPRATDRQAIAEAFAISEESLEQSFAFIAGQWLVASHDATGLKGTPFPVQLPNANDAVRKWLELNQPGA